MVATQIFSFSDRKLGKMNPFWTGVETWNHQLVSRWDGKPSMMCFFILFSCPDVFFCQDLEQLGFPKRWELVATPWTALGPVPWVSGPSVMELQRPLMPYLEALASRWGLLGGWPFCWGITTWLRLLWSIQDIGWVVNLTKLSLENLLRNQWLPINKKDYPWINDQEREGEMEITV